jgi:hypothetical protein
MRLTETQSRELLQKHGVYVTEVCDKCGKPLGHVRFTHFGQKGEWCSRECRDGVEAADRYRTTRKHVTEHATESNGLEKSLRSRKGGRPRRHETNADRQRAYRKRQAAA